MAFKDEYEYLLHLLCCAVNKTVPEDIPDGLSFERVLEYGKMHEVANIAFIAVEKLKTPPANDVFNLWRQEYWKAVKRDTAQNKARNEIADALHSHGIYTLEVQGTVVKKYYPQSYLRMMSDIDFIIPAEKLSEAQEVMQSIGYQAELTYDKNEIQAVKQQMHIELHTEFFEVGQNVHKALNHPFSLTSLNSDYTAAVSDTVFYLFHLLHTVKHATEFMGVGIRRIIDLYYLENALKDKVDFSYIDGVLKQHKLYDIKQKLIAVKEHWFCGAEPDEEILEFEKDILESGNHGNNEIFFRNRFRNEQARGKRLVKLMYLIYFIFPKKEDVYRSYPFCKRHRLPTVYCWLHRWLFTVFNIRKWKKLKKVFTNMRVKIK